MSATVESRVVYAAGVVQGVALVTFPAASSVFTDPSDYDLSTTQYGTMFVPQFLLAVVAALVGATASRKVGTRKVYLLGLVANLLSMTLLLVSAPLAGTGPVAFVLLLCATACLGVGFGLTVPSLNTFAADLHSDNPDAAVLVLNALLGLGTALAPLLVAVFVGLGVWWALPALMVVALLAVLIVSSRLSLSTGQVSSATSTGSGRGSVPARFWLFASFAVLYGIVETMNGNWAVLDMTGHVGASATMASLALTAFWGMVTLGRLVFAKVPIATTRIYHVLPFVLIASFVLIAMLPVGATGMGIAAFALAGIGCSALLPLTISYAQEQLTVMTTAVAGGIIAFYQIGYGIAAFGAGALQDAGITLSTLFGWTAAVALAAGVLSFFVTSSSKPATTTPLVQGP